jgi:hypothetical protein
MKKAKAPCEVCAEYRAPNVTGLRDIVFTHKDEPPWLRSPKEVDDYPGLTKETASRHRVKSDDLIAQYDFRGNDWRGLCSFPGRHRHAMGFIGRTVCGLTLVIGHQCGEEWIDGLKDAKRRLEAARTYFAAKAAIDRMAEELPRMLPAEQIENLAKLRRDLSDLFPHIAKELSGDRPFRFAGAGLWRAKPTPPGLALRARLTELLRQSRAMRPDTPAREALKLSKAFDRLDPEIREARRWYEGAAPFATRENLKAVLDSFGVAAQFDDAGVATIVGKSDRPFRIGLGVFELAPLVKRG